jgi:hypothetical protein
MKTKYFILLSVLICCLVWFHGAWAETKGYTDSGQNPVTFIGVLGAEYTGTNNGTAVRGSASAQTEGVTYGGHFTPEAPVAQGFIATLRRIQGLLMAAPLKAKAPAALG